jgi:hypothetical protein
MELELAVRKKATVTEPTRLVLLSQYKVGKTSNLAKLPNSVIIDLERSADFYECASFDVKALAEKQGIGLYSMLVKISNLIREENKKKGGFVYDYGIIDTTTVLENIARTLATHLYKKSTIGKQFQGDDVVTQLPQGAGYEWLRTAFKTIYDMFQGLFGKCLILSGHVKTASIQKDGKDLTAKDMALTGKLKMIVCSDADAIGFIYRKGDTNENVLSFKTTEQDLATGARLDYLSGQEFVISKKEDGVLTTYWEHVFPSLKSEEKVDKKKTAVK